MPRFKHGQGTEASMTTGGLAALSSASKTGHRFAVLAAAKFAVAACKVRCGRQ
jgi:hypothetical protein